jgi:nucleotide-binding universal stress UspA family protein
MPIICGTDLSAASADALDVARALAVQRGEDEVVLVHVVDADGPAASEPALDKARAELTAQAQSRPGSPAVRAELVVGPSEEALVRYAETERADLIVIAARSTGGSLFRIGSTAAHIVSRTTVPVILVRDPAPWLAYTKGERPLRALLGIDDSATCDLGIQWLQAMRARGQVDVVLGAIYYPDEAAAHYGLDPRALVDRDPEIERLMERDLLRRFGGSGKHVVAKPRLGLGRIGDHVIELAREEKVDAIIVGTSQKTGLGRLGSVSSVIVNDAPQSVICVPPQAAIATVTVPTLRTALVATDLSGFANRAVAYAFAMTPADGEVHIVHVLEDDTEADEVELTKQLYALAPTSAAQKVTAHIVRGDDAATSLAQCAARLGVDVICISSHGRSGIARALVGSVADRLLRATRLPVLVLRPS